MTAAGERFFRLGLNTIKQILLPLFFAYAHVGFAVGKGNVQLLPLLQNIGVADDLSACVFDDGKAAFQNVLRRNGFEQCGLGSQTLAAAGEQLAEGGGQC
ncbi:hypothetical protein NEIPOLOT_01428, partial [Neisseria polysaccharea ATCC 43768]